jgi:plastocyanin
LKRLLRLLILPAILIPLALSSLSCGDDDDDSNPVNPGGGTADVTITMQGGMSGTYSPNPANLTVGQTVRWVNNDNMTHSATHASAFNVTVGAGSSSAIITMTNAGTFGYICNQPGHSMSGSIVVAP